MVTCGLFIPGSEPNPFTVLAFLLLFPLPLSSALMEHGDTSRGSWASKEVDDPQRRNAAVLMTRPSPGQEAC
jgi:hypothetical protein